MSAQSKGLVPVGIVVCASLAALALQGLTEWVADLIVSASAGLAGRWKGGGAESPPSLLEDRLGPRRRASWRHALRKRVGTRARRVPPP